MIISDSDEDEEQKSQNLEQEDEDDDQVGGEDFLQYKVLYNKSFKAPRNFLPKWIFF